MANQKTSHALPQSPLTKDDLHLIDAWWRACNYLSVGMIYLRDNPLLKEPLKLEHVKHRDLHNEQRVHQVAYGDKRVDRQYRGPPVAEDERQDPGCQKSEARE